MLKAIIIAGVRTAIGRVGGTLKDITVDSGGGQGITTIVENIM